MRDSPPERQMTKTKRGSIALTTIGECVVMTICFLLDASRQASRR